MKWEPWHTFKQMDEELALPIPEPPCKDCHFWQPRRTYDRTGSFSGIACCIVGEQCHDFSCYREKKDESGKST